MILSKSDRSRIEVGSSRLLGIVGQPTYLPIPVIRHSLNFAKPTIFSLPILYLYLQTRYYSNIKRHFFLLLKLIKLAISRATTLLLTYCTSMLPTLVYRLPY
jgi:hypothetical protein